MNHPPDHEIQDVRACMKCCGEGCHWYPTGVEHMGVEEFSAEPCMECEGQGLIPVEKPKGPEATPQSPS